MSAEGVFELEWDTAEAKDGTYWLMANVTDTFSPTPNTAFDMSNASFQVFNPHPPRVSVKYPDGGEILSDDVTIFADAWDIDDDITDAGVTFHISADGGANWTLLGESGPPETGFSGKVRPDGAVVRQYVLNFDTTQVPDGSNYTIRASVLDTDGLDGSDTSNSTFTVDNVPDGPPGGDGDGGGGTDEEPELFSSAWIRANFMCGVVFLIILIVAIIGIWAAVKASKKKREKQKAVQELRDTFDDIRDEVRGMETSPPPMPGEPGYDDGATLDFGASDQAYAAGIGEVPSDYGSDYSVGAGEIDLDYSGPADLEGGPAAIEIPDDEEVYETPADDGEDYETPGDDEELLDGPVDEDELLGEPGGEDLDADAVPAAVPMATPVPDGTVDAGGAGEEMGTEGVEEHATDAGTSYSLPPEDADTDELLDGLETGEPPGARLGTPSAGLLAASPVEKRGLEGPDDDDDDADDEGIQVVDDELVDGELVEGELETGDLSEADILMGDTGLDVELDLDDDFEKESSPDEDDAEEPGRKERRAGEKGGTARARPAKARVARAAATVAAVPAGDAVPATPASAPGETAGPSADEGVEDPDRLDPPKLMKCRCGGDIPVHTRKRPLEVQCPSCGAKATLKKKKKP
jgi:hypothetical protein